MKSNTTFEQFTSQLRRMQAIADRVIDMRRNRAKKLCLEAGLDPNLLGIHPHNAMCSYHNGKPWPNVNYSKVRACIRVMNSAWDANKLVNKWYIDNVHKIQ